MPPLLAPGYYAQRASAGLIISEAAAVSRQGTGYDNGPGLYTDEQVAGWRAVTDAVHEAGGRIFVQLFHVGRMSHPAFQEGGLPVGASAVAAGPATERYDGTHSFTRPRALQITELADITGQFRAAAGVRSRPGERLPGRRPCGAPEVIPASVRICSAGPILTPAWHLGPPPHVTWPYGPWQARSQWWQILPALVSPRPAAGSPKS